MYCREEEFGELDDSKWVDDFSSEREQNKELSDTAKELLGSVNDPKFSNSEVSHGWSPLRHYLINQILQICLQISSFKSIEFKQTTFVIKNWCL